MKVGLERREPNEKEALEMKGTKKIGRVTGKVTLALLAGVLMPILIWVALGVAMTRRLGRLQRAPAPTIRGILAAAGTP